MHLFTDVEMDTTASSTYLPTNVEEKTEVAIPHTDLDEES